MSFQQAGSGAGQQRTEGVQKQLDELYTLLRAGEHNATSTKHRAISIITELAPEDLYWFMQQCINTGHAPTCCSSAKVLAVDCSSPPSPPFGCEEASPKQYAPASKGDNNSKHVSSSSSPVDSEDVQLELPDSPGKRARTAADVVQQQQQRQGPSRGRFLAESLDLNLGASYDLLSNASIADFSTAAAAARLSTTHLMRQSRLRVLSPVAEASFASAAAPLDTQHEDDVSFDGSEAGADTPASLPSSPTAYQPQQQQHHGENQSQQQQQGQEVLQAAGHCSWQQSPCDAQLIPAAAQQDACPIASACSSPREPAADAAAEPASAAARRRLSVAESASDWPSSQPLPFAAYDADAGATSPVVHSPVRATLTPPFGAAEAAAYTPAAASGAGAVMSSPAHRAVMSAPQPQRATSRIPSSGGTGAFAGVDDAGAGRSGGVNPIGQLVMAPIHGANVLRRSLTKLWGGPKPASRTLAPPGTPLQGGLAAAAGAGGSPSSTPSSRPAAGRPLASTGSPAAAAYSRVTPPSKGPGLRGASTSPALQQPCFSVTQHGSSPTKAAAAAVAAASRRPSSMSPGGSGGTWGPTVGGSSSSSSSKPRGNISYTPGAGRSAAATGASSRLQPAQAAGAGHGTQGLQGRAGSATPTRLQQLSALQQQQQHCNSRPSSAASMARTDVTVTGTGSYTSGGVAMARFTGADSVRTGLKTPQLSKQPRHSRIPGRPGTVLQEQQHSGFAFAAAGGAGFTGGSGSSKAVVGRGGHSRIGAGRLGLRRSRSCGNMAEMLGAATDVAGMRQMWQQLEKQQQHQQQHQPAGAARAKLGLRHLPTSTGGAPAAAAAAGMAPHSRIGCGAAGAARPSSYQQQPHKQHALGQHAAAGEVFEDGDACLPVLSRCHSPPSSSQSQCGRATGPGASVVLARMGDVIGHVDALLAAADGNTRSSQ